MCQTHYNFDMFKLVFFVPAQYAEEVKNAVFRTGAGKYELYDHCSWETNGTGQFRPTDKATPFIGQIGEVERVEELRVEVLCRPETVRPAIEALIAAHPYEEPAYEVFQVWQITDLPDPLS